MERKKFIVNGREKETFELSNEELLMLIEKGDITDDERKLLKDKVIERFKYACCKRNGESGDELFARTFGDYVNHCPNDFKKAAKAMGNEHRYLQQEMFKVCIEYIKVLAEHYENGFYDARNKWACSTASNIKYYYDGL